MATLIFVGSDGTKTEIDCPAGQSVMQVAINSDIDGIVAECGGNIMCATCHVYVSGESADALPQITEAEDEMLECTAAEREPNSRLSCQLPVTDVVDSLIITMPERQQ